MINRKSVFAAAALVAAGALVLTGCSSAPSGGSTPGASEGEKSFKIGISQFVQHDALDATREGFIQAFTDAGYTEGKNVEFEVQNAQAEMATATTIASKFASSNVDLVLAIATPSAQAAATAISDKPILFTAVTEPVVAKLVSSWDKPGGNITGTSDLNPVEKQIGLIKDAIPDAKKVAVIYSSGEVNSDVQVEMAKEAAEKLGMEIVEKTVTNSSEVGQAASAVGDVDAIYIPTDNKVTDGLSAVIQFAEQNKIPVFGAEEGQVDKGAVATYGINYKDLGVQTGKMALRILVDGEKPADMKVETLDKITLIINPAAAERMGLTLPESIVSEAEKVVE